jgi:hypothetical protein
MTEEIDLDLRGHWRDGATILELWSLGRHLLQDMQLSMDLMGRKFPDADRSPTDWVGLGPCSSGPLGRGCPSCGVQRFDLETNGQALRLSGERCSLPNGFPLNEWELNVPSGKMVVANDLREWFPLPVEESDCGTVIGSRAISNAYAAVGLAHASVGNSCPGVYRVADGRYKVACEPADDYVPLAGAPPFEGERVAIICTDLWWYSLCDFDEIERRIEKFGGVGSRGRYEVIDVKPGVYRFRHNDDARSNRGQAEVLFSTFEWVRESDPVQSFYMGDV